MEAPKMASKTPFEKIFLKNREKWPQNALNVNFLDPSEIFDFFLKIC